MGGYARAPDARAESFRSHLSALFWVGLQKLQRERLGLMGVRGNIMMTPAAILAHCEKKGFAVPSELRTADTLPLKTLEKIGDRIRKLGDGMSKPEREMGMILEAQKRRQEIVDYRFQGMSLAYSQDPETGILLRYKCDYVVIVACKEMIPFLTGPGKTSGQVDVESAGHMRFEQYAAIKIIECKGHGKHAVSAAAKLRFKGAKSAWPMFKFEMWQRDKEGRWARIL